MTSAIAGQHLAWSVVLVVRRSILVLVAGCWSALLVAAVTSGPARADGGRPQSPPASTPVDDDDRTVETTPEHEATSPTTTVPRGRLIPIPAGCPRPNLPTVVFVGRIVDSDATTARFRLQQVRAGSADRYSRDGLIDVEYGIDTKYLQEGGQYLVGAAVDGETGRLTSKVREEQPLFGGNDVVGVAESHADCPVTEDPIRTLTVTGRSIESGVLEPLKHAKSDMLRAIVVPMVVAFAILLGLSTLRWILTGMAHGATSAITHQRDRRLNRPHDDQLG